MHNKKKVALITGVLGQDGYYLSRFLISMNYQIIGTTHRDINFDDLKNIQNGIEYIKLDLTNKKNIEQVLIYYKPDEIYNLAARASSSTLNENPLETIKINGMCPLFFVDGMLKFSKLTKFCQISSSEIFAGGIITPQNENTPFYPINSYGAAKIYANNIISIYRKNYNLFIANAIMFNHESERRAVEYVSRKITSTVAKIYKGYANELILGSLDSKRDWGYADDYVKGLWLIMQQEEPSDFIFATGILHSVRDFCEIAFSHVGLNYLNYIKVDKSLIRIENRIDLVGNSSKLKKIGWDIKTDFTDMVKKMVDYDLQLLN